MEVFAFRTVVKPDKSPRAPGDKLRLGLTGMMQDEAPLHASITAEIKGNKGGP